MPMWRPVKGSVALHEKAQVLFQRQKERRGCLGKVVYTPPTLTHMHTL